MSEVVNVGFLGLGQMGGAMAERLLGGRFRLHVHDPAAAAMERFVAAGAVSHPSPRSVADAASIVLACLPNQDVSLAASLGSDGVIHGSAIKIHAEMSTIGKEVIEKIAAGLAPRGIATVDAPITGGPPAARAGNLTMLVSGSAPAVDAVRPLLAVIGKEIHVLGTEPGQAQVMKMVNNLLMATNMVVACEGLTFGAKAGLDPEAMLRVLRAGTGQSFSACTILERAVDGRFDYGAALTIVHKDMLLGVEEASAAGVQMPVIEQARNAWHSAYEEGWGDADFTTILKALEQKTGVIVRTRAASAKPR